jgi:hypothetical protein
MSDSSVIKEFLVVLGFKTDESALKKFSDGIERATKSVFLLATAVTATATAVAIGVERFAGNMEKLYYASIRTGTSASHIKAFQRTIEDFGGTAEDAMASIEGLTTFLRNNPGGGSMINQWLAGVGKQITGDKAVDLASIGEVFAKNTREGNAFLNDQLASKWGISAATALEIQMPGFGRQQQDISRRLDQAGFGKATEDAKNFMRALREMGDWLTIIGTRVLDVLQNKLGFSMQKLNAYLEANGEQIANKIVAGVELFLKFAGKLETLIEWLIKAFTWLDDKTGGVSTKIIGVLTLLSLFGGFKIISGILKVGEAFLGLGKAMGLVGKAAPVASAAEATAAAAARTASLERAAAAEAGAARATARAAALEAAGDVAGAATARGSAAASLSAAAAARAAAGGAGGAAARFGLLRGAGAALSFLTGVGELAGAGYLGYQGAAAFNDAFPDNPLAKIGEGLSHGASDVQGAWHDARNPNEKSLKLLAGLGWSPEQAAGIVANLRAESQLNPDAYGDYNQKTNTYDAYGIGQWHKDRQAAFARHYGHDIHGTSREEQLDFVNYELRHGEDAGAREAGRRIKSTDKARDAAQYFTRLYERPGDIEGESRRRGDLASNIAKGGVHLESKTTIHVASATPQAITEMERAQNRVNAETVRNMKLVSF